MSRWTGAATTLLIGTSAACGAGTPGNPKSAWASPAELTWLQAYGGWSDSVYTKGRTLDTQ